MVRPRTGSTLFPTRRSSDLHVHKGRDIDLRKRGRAAASPRSAAAVTAAIYGQCHELISETPLRHVEELQGEIVHTDRKSTRLNSSHSSISYAVFCLKKKINS